MDTSTNGIKAIKQKAARAAKISKGLSTGKGKESANFHDAVLSLLPSKNPGGIAHLAKQNEQTCIAIKESLTNGEAMAPEQLNQALQLMDQLTCFFGNIGYSKDAVKHLDGMRLKFFSGSLSDADLVKYAVKYQLQEHHA